MSNGKGQNMKKIIAAVVIGSFLAGSAAADFNWNAESGVWSDGANWLNTASGTTGTKPDGSANVNLRFSSSSICTLNTDEGLFTNRLVVQNGQTWNIENGGRVGFAWSRVGRGSAATVNMTGNGTFVLNNDDLYIGLETGGQCIWSMYDTSTLMVEPSTSGGGDNLYIAQDTSIGTLRLIGSQVTVHANEVIIGYVRTAGTNPVATVEFVMDAGGASRIISDDATRILTGSPGPEAKAHLLLSAPAVSLPARDIVLIECLSASAISGRGVFDTLNGGSAAEGTTIILGGNLYTLTYKYAADGLTQNDVALRYVRSAAHMAQAPVPADQSVLSSSPLTLSWTNPDPNDGSSPITCTVYLGTEPNRLQMDFVRLTPNASSVEINLSNFKTYGSQPLPNKTTFYWAVDCDDPSADPNDGIGLFWTFYTDYNNAPFVDAGPDQAVWLGKSGIPGQETVILSGTVTDEGLPNPPGTTSILWTQVSGPVQVTPVPTNAAVSSVTITTPGIYVFRLSADDGEKQAEDTVQIIVGNDSCHASYLNGAQYNSKDFNTDCIVDLTDLQMFISDWLTCTNTQEGCQ
jgi:hypothetical protein